MTRTRGLCTGVAAAALMLLPTGALAQVSTTTVAPAAASEAERLRAELEVMAGVRGASRDPLADAFFPPELVMAHQRAIGLTAEQRTAIVTTIADAQPRFIDAQWQLEPEVAALAELVRGSSVDEQALLAQIDRVLEIERRMKRVQAEMLVRIKNELTQEQQEQLARLGGRRLMGYLGGSGGMGFGGFSYGTGARSTAPVWFPPGR